MTLKQFLSYLFSRGDHNRMRVTIGSLSALENIILVCYKLCRTAVVLLTVRCSRGIVFR